MNRIPKITPVPQSLSLREGEVRLGSLAVADFEIVAKSLDGSLAFLAYERLCEKLSKMLNVNAKDARGSVKIELSVSKNVPAQIKKNANQAYSIEAQGDSIKLIGYGAEGLYFAVTTLLQCVELSDGVATVSELSLLDWPDLKTRGHFMECRYGSNLMELEDWKALVDDMEEKKMNQLVVALYGCWCIQYDGVISEYLYIPLKKYPQLSVGVIKKYYSPEKGEWISETVPTPMAEKDFFGDLIAYGKTRGVEVLPLWNSYGHNSLVPRKIPSISARDEKGNLTGYGFCVSNPETYEFFYSVFDEIIERYLAPNGIDSFHIGLDEVRDDIATDTTDIFKENSPWCRCPECSKLSNEDKFINHAVKLISHLKSRGMKNVYIYSDMLTKIINPEKFRDILKDNDILDVTVADWWTYTNDKNSMMYDTMHPELGIRSTIKPWNSYYHWDMTFDTAPNVHLLCELADREQSAEGLQSYSAWDKVCDKNHTCMADYSWNFKGTGSVSEFNERYAYRVFGDKAEKAAEALSLMDEITNQGTDCVRFSDTIVDQTMSNISLLRSLTYYKYSYVQPQKPYPRNFPGEAFEGLVPELDAYKKQLERISEMAHKATELFAELSEEGASYSSLAARFKCEARNYSCIADDYLALFEIRVLMEKDERSASVSEKIAALATERKNERLSLMLGFERTKEEFLLPSHLRNQAIFMQLFADIESYVKKTDPKELELDVCDLQKVASENFFALR